MTRIQNLIRQANRWTGRALTAMVGLLMALAPGFAQAAGGENVALQFSSTDTLYIWISLGFGAIAIFAGWLVGRWVLGQSPGNEAMQEVGSAIKNGALAYLKRQFNTMLIFVALLAVLLFFLYQGSYGPFAVWVSVAFIGGVAASYIAGYAGMIMAVNANTRTAHAALTSYKSSLEIAFRSGAVAGLLTVGMGLIGAALIFLLAKGEAMKLLIGFGFGGSLAALFMRVGGGIFTKAADVGADLVGKVEAGIPEDDPRNPATIADNVGDNVGDCAGMAADIFESYEVTLVAAIVLGAATAAIFDTSTWMKLILFALMARGVGIIASIIGIFMVKGTDNVDADPLKPIRKGFISSAAIASILTIGLAYFMMNDQIKSIKLTSPTVYQKAEFEAINKAKKDIAKTKYSGDESKVTAKDIQDSQVGKDLNLTKPEDTQQISALMGQAMDENFKEEELNGFAPINVSDEKNPALKYTVQRITSPSQQVPDYVSLKDQINADIKAKEGKKGLKVFQIRIERSFPAPPAERGKPQAPPQTQVQEIFYGPVDHDTALKQIEQANRTGQGLKIDIQNQWPSEYLSNLKGEVAIGVGADKDGKPFDKPHKLQGAANFYYTDDAATVKKKEEERRTDFSKPAPATKQMKVGSMERKDVPWWGFAACILFGVLMAFFFEILTDYYVSTHKKPVQEVGQVASAGPAPMIIQGFAYALESSVMSVLAIVVALIMPMIIFPPGEFGGYVLSFYGIALVGLGLLTTTGYILAMDTFGPISDNAQGVFEMSGAGHANPVASKAVQRLDAAGNTTKALTKGFAIATAVVAAVALFHSYVDSAKLVDAGMPLELPAIFLGLLLGAAAPFLFSAFLINAVGRASFDLIQNVRDQFRKDPGILKGTSKPDYGQCVSIVTAAAQKELLGPGILAIFLPLAVAFGFALTADKLVTIGGVEYNLVGAQALGGFLAGAIVSGQLLAVLLANSGGMWDNAKKLIEDGLHGGKGTEAHKAGVVCDTVGDPFKDTAGPALNPLIKVMNLVGLLLAPLVIVNWPKWVNWTILGVSVALLVLSFWWSKRGSLSTSLTRAAGGGEPALEGAGAPVPTATSEGEKTE